MAPVAGGSLGDLIHTYVYMFVCVCVYIYIYIYIHTLFVHTQTDIMVYHTISTKYMIIYHSILYHIMLCYITGPLLPVRPARQREQDLSEECLRLAPHREHGGHLPINQAIYVSTYLMYLSLSLSIHICICIYTYTIYIYIYICMNIYIYIYTYTWRTSSTPSWAGRRPRRRGAPSESSAASAPPPPGGGKHK